jgi:PAS domain S-box-containing protein
MPLQLDSRTWRADLLQLILNVAVTLGAVVYVLSVTWAWREGLQGIIIVDTLVIVALVIVWWLRDLPYLVRAVAVSAAIYFLGAALLTVAGSVAQIYLVGHSAMTTVLLGLRAGLASVAINTLTVLVIGLSGWANWIAAPAGWEDQRRDWILVASNSLLVSTMLVLAIGGVLGTLENALRREVTARRVLKEREQRLQTLIDSTPDAVMVLDSAGTLLETNPAGLRMLGAETEEDIVGKPFADLLADDDKSQFRRFNEDVCAGSKGRMECVVEGLHGTRAGVEIVSAPMPISDAVILHLAIARDLTANRQLEEQLRRSQRLDAVGKLTGGVAHDFNNLLTVILGSADELCETLNEDSYEYGLADTARGAAERGAALTRRLLAFSRQQTLAPQPTDVGVLMAGMESLLHRTLGDDVEVAVETCDGPCIAEIDPHQLENAILNLCINARDAMPGGGRLTIEAAAISLAAADVLALDELQPGEYVTVTVTDTGEGMTPETLARAFEPFFTTKEAGRGTGLGLSMVYGFVRQSNGQARIYSEPGQGTTIRLFLPAADAPDAVAPRVPSDTVAPRGNEHILLVEDNDALRALVTAQLDQLGYRVTAAANGPEALRLLETGQSFDLLFTDVIMPGGMNGRQLADAAIALQPGLPVLFTSGYSENAIVRDGRVPPGTLLLSKPYRRAELADKLRQALARADA